MAEIKIQEKKSSVWPWILGILIVAVIAFIIFTQMNKKEPAETAAPADSTSTGTLDEPYPDNPNRGAKDEAAALVTFIENNDTTKADDAFVREGFTHLNAAIKAVMSEESITDSTMLSQSDSLTRFTSGLTGTETLQVNNIKTGFISAADLIKGITKQSPNLQGDAAELDKKAKSLNARKTVNEQSDKIKDYFRAAGKVLQSVANKEV